LLFVSIAGSFYDRVGDEYNTRKGNKSAHLWRVLNHAVAYKGNFIRSKRLFLLTSRAKQSNIKFPTSKAAPDLLSVFSYLHIPDFHSVAPWLFVSTAIGLKVYGAAGIGNDPASL